MPSVVTPAGVAAEPIGQPVDVIQEALGWYVSSHQGGGTKMQRRKQAAAFQLVRLDNWRPTDAAHAIGYTPVGLRGAIERVRLALESWWAERAEGADQPDELAEDLAAVA